MANFRQSTNGSLFRILVTPAVLLCVIFRKPVFQWIAVTALGAWLLILLVSALKRSAAKRKRKRAEKKLAKLSTKAPVKVPQETETPESELFLIRQINIRVTEQLKQTYPRSSWIRTRKRRSWTRTVSRLSRKRRSASPCLSRSRCST